MVRKEEFKRIKLVWDEKYYEAFANAVGCCCLQKNSVGNHALAKGIQQLCDNAKCCDTFAMLSSQESKNNPEKCKKND